MYHMRQCSAFHIFTGDLLQHEDGQYPLHSLEQAAAHYASAIRLNSRDARLHFQLGPVLEEHHRDVRPPEEGMVL